MPKLIPSHIPQHFNWHAGDVVTYNTETRNRYKASYTKCACFGPVRHALGQVAIECHPGHTKYTGVDERTFITWIELCRQAKLIAQCVSTWRKGNHNHMELPISDDYEPVQVFSALCCYRWVDSYPGMVWQIVDHVKQGMNFWLALHYGCATYIHNTNHSFFNIAKYSVYNKSRENLAQSLAAKACYLCPELRPDPKENFKFGCFSQFIDSYARILQPMSVSSVGNMLRTELNELYDMITSTQLTRDGLKELRSLYQSIIRRF